MDANARTSNLCASQDLEAIDTGFAETQVSHENIVVNDPHVSIQLSDKPSIGMEFKTVEMVRDFYNSFAKKRGYAVRIRSTKPKRAVLVCYKEGRYNGKSCGNEDVHDIIGQRKRKGSTSRTDCQASLIVSRGTIEGNRIIKYFNDDHNHVMVSPASVSYLRSHKKMSVAAKSLVEKFEEEGMPTGKVARMFNKGGLFFFYLLRF